MKPELFSTIIQKLTRDFLVVSLEGFLNNPDFPRGKRKVATVSFDDGYKDNIEYAAPILNKYSCPASFYLVTGSIDKNLPTWTYLLDNVLQKTNKKTIELSYDFVPPALMKLELQNRKGDFPSALKLKPWMKNLSNTSRVIIFNAVMDQCNDVELPVNKMMNWNDIRQLVTDDFVVGSHSHTHPLLASIESEREIEAELKTSADRIMGETGSLPLSISYPIGSFDNRVIDLAKKSGYKYGLAVKQRFFQYNNDNLFQIPRVELYQEPWWKTQLRISGTYNNLKRIWN